MSEPKIFTTAEWGARNVSSNFSTKPARGIVVHNTQSPNRAPKTGNAEQQAAFALARSIQNLHMDDNHWSDTGQHFTISRGGLLMEGRHGSLTAARSGKVVKGAHACGVGLYNTQWFGIEIEGDNLPTDQVTQQQFDALVELCAWLCFWGGVDSAKIIPHKEVKEGCTDCPRKFADRVPTLRDAVHNRKLDLLMDTTAGKITRAGKMSTFGGPRDTGVGANEGLALVSSVSQLPEYFLAQQPPGTTGLARRLNPDKFYIACRWDFHKTPRAHLISTMVTVTNPVNGKSAQAKPVDFGPAIATQRIADLSPGLANRLGLDTDDDCIVETPLP